MKYDPMYHRVGDESGPITNRIHINYANAPRISFCDDYCTKGKCGCAKCDCASFAINLCFCCGILIGLIVLTAIPFSIGYGGYLVVLEGIGQRQYGNTFTIQGTCEIWQVHVTELSDCHRDSDGPSNLNCDRKQYITIYDFQISDTTNFTTFPCANGSDRVYKQRFERKPEHEKNDSVTCYTNDDCDDVWIGVRNDHHSIGGWIFFGAALIFCIDLCCICCYVVLMIRGGREQCYWFGECRHSLCKVRIACCSCHFSKYFKARMAQKEEYYASSWRNMESKKQCDYVLGNWTRTMEWDFNDDVLDLIVDYHDCSKKYDTDSNPRTRNTYQCV